MVFARLPNGTCFRNSGRSLRGFPGRRLSARRQCSTHRPAPCLSCGWAARRHRACWPLLRIELVLLFAGEPLGVLFGDCLFDLIGSQPATGQVFEIEIFRGPPVREADFIASAVGDGFVFDDPDLQARPRAMIQGWSNSATTKSLRTARCRCAGRTASPRATR